jgi:putative FmdB family regulatory protein
VPIYEYACPSCQSRFEVKQKFSDPPVLACVRCGQAVTKVISAPAIMFKGSGWYVTDYSDKLKAPASSDTTSNGQKDQKDQPAAASAAGHGTSGATESSATSSTTTAGTGSAPTTPGCPPSSSSP